MNPTTEQLSKLPQLIAYRSLYDSRIKQHVKLNFPRSIDSILRQHLYSSGLITANQRGELWTKGVFVWKKQNLSAEVKLMYRRAAAALSAGSTVPIWPESLRTSQKLKEKEKKTPNSWCFVFLHHLAFLRHIIILTFQADRLQELPAVTQKHRNSSQVELLP